MNVIITGTCFSFPNGTGAAARVMAFAKGLMHHGATVKVLCLKPTGDQPGNTGHLCVNGVYEGIPFEYTCGQRTVAKSRTGALLLYLKGLWRACRLIRGIHRETPVDAILLWYAELPINFLVFHILAKSIGAVLIAEKSEFPFVYHRKTPVLRMQMWFNERFTYKLLDGVIVISGFLQEFFAAHLSKTAKLLRVPILVDPGLFPQATEITEGAARKIIFCGQLEHESEVGELLKAFARLASEFSQWSVEIIGPTPKPSTAAALQEMVVRFGLSGRVLFAGAVPRSEVPARLLAGDIMALPRASGTFSTAGFPTKLGEYLASGKPVVVTKTGEIPQYLQDRVNAFLTPPDDTEAFTNTMRYVLSHPEEAREVGRRGREVAAHYFDFQFHGARIAEFIRSLRQAALLAKPSGNSRQFSRIITSMCKLLAKSPQE
jgi:glycosyltransferase involved in cell wall biosynthesis